MGFWGYMFICDLIIPVAMLICGRMMWKHCPKNINGIVGYRTARSMKNMDTWKFAHDHYGKLLWKIGWFLMIPSALILLPLYRSSVKMIGMVGGILAIIQCIVWIISIVPTEKALKNILMRTEFENKRERIGAKMELIRYFKENMVFIPEGRCKRQESLRCYFKEKELSPLQH